MLPWFKFTHVEYLLDPVITGLSLIAQGANTRLMAYAALQSPFATLPNDFEQLAVMCGVKIKQWEKLSKELMGKVWFVGEDGRLFCPMMIVESAPVVEQETKKENKPKKALTNAERQAAHKARQKELALLVEQSNEAGNEAGNETGNEEVTLGNGNSNAQVTDSNGAGNESNVTGNGQVTDSNGDFVTNEGVGGDLDLDKKLDLDSKKTSEDKSSGSLPPTAKPIDPPTDSQVPPDSFTTTARETLWTVGVPLLTQYGSNDKAARSFLGQMVKIYGEDMVAESVISARTTKPMDATAYIGGFLKNKAKQNINQGTQARKQTSHVPDNNSTSWMTPELEAQLNAKFAA